MLAKTIIVATLSLGLGLLATVQRDDAPNEGGPANDDTMGLFQGSAEGRFEDPRLQKFHQIQDRVANATQKLRSATSSSEIAAAESELKDALNADYSFRMDGYGDHLDRLEKKLDTMREKLSRRRQAQDEMVELRIKVLKAEANDLGWPATMPGAYSPGTFGDSVDGFGSGPEYERLRYLDDFGGSR